MAVIVSLSDVIEQMDLMTDEARAYINRILSKICEEIVLRLIVMFGG